MRDVTCPALPCEGHGGAGDRSQASRVPVVLFCNTIAGFMTHRSSSKQSCLPCRHHSHQQGCCLGPWAPQVTSLLGLTCSRAPKTAVWGGEGLADLLLCWAVCQRLGHITGPSLCRAGPGQYVTKANLAETAGLPQLTMVTCIYQDVSLLVADGMQRVLPVCVLPEMPPRTI